MRVLIDCGRLRNGKSGLGVFAKQFAAALVGARPDNMSFLFVTHPAFAEFAALAQKIGANHIKGEFSPLNQIARLFNKNIYAYTYNGASHAVRHGVYRQHFGIPAADKSPFVLTLHDMHFLHYKQKSVARNMARQKKSVNRAAAVCFISRYAQEATAERINLSGKQTHIIHNGVDKPSNPARPRWFASNMRPFLFCIGEFAPHKRFEFLPPLLPHLPGMRLIIAGKKREGAQPAQDAANRAGVGGRVVLPGLVSEEEKAWLLQECAGFVFPSAREGFGMPVIEAFHYGKPVFCFAATALPEVGGEHAHYWQSQDPKEMAELVAEGVECDNAAAAQARKQWAAGFSWQKNAEAHIKIYRRLAGR